MTSRLVADQSLTSGATGTDGQLGGIMKVYRDWRISGNSDWMKDLYPHVKQSLDYCIASWDPDHNGVITAHEATRLTSSSCNLSSIRPITRRIQMTIEAIARAARTDSVIQSVTGESNA